MRSLSTITAVFCLMVINFSLNSFSVKAQWEWQNPLPQGNSIYSIEFINENEGWAGGEFSTIIHTTDGGENWEFQHIGKITIIYDIEFINDQNGIAVGGYPYCDRTIYKTENGGADWVEVLGSGYNPLYDLFLLNNDTCMVVGAYGEFLLSVNGGNTWNGQYTGFDNHFNSCWFFNSDDGWIVGDDGIILRKTSGTPWTKYDSLTAVNLSGIYFTDQEKGWICGDKGTLFKTNNGGQTWDLIPALTDYLLQEIDFCGPDTGWITARDVLKTINGGETWEVQDVQGISGTYPNGSAGFIASYGGDLYRTFDGGTEWTEISSGFHGVIRDICFINQNEGWAIENPSGVNSILHTINGGKDWERIAANDYFSDAICFIDEQEGWASGRSEIYHTSNGGRDWEVQMSYSLNDQLVDIIFIDHDHGWALLQTDTIYRTTDGGVSWESIHLDSFGFNEAFFIDQDNGWIVGYTSNILKTNDGGLSWTDISPGEKSGEYESVFFVDQFSGWVVGGDNVILHTDDGGSTWENQSEYYPRTLYSVSFPDSLNGWICASYGEIFHTTDGGSNWEEQQSYCWEYLFKIIFTDEYNGWAAGMYGTILHTGNGGMVGVKEPGILPSKELINSYPNPVRHSMVIEYELINPEFVTVKIFNNLGQQIESLLQEVQIPGKHQLTWDADNYPTGLYFYSVTMTNKTSIGKIVVVR